ncbi:MAG: hypothetical protein V5B44_09665 [Candidatus Accumulibacter necessarius]|uniref:hypothetical protein n=1 Tax=Candidatus Accumulibacter necessarius TaxID=2954386 RepID=UPI002FC3D5D6
MPRVESRQRQPAEAMRQLTDVETGLMVAGKRQPLRSERRWRQAARGAKPCSAQPDDALEQRRSATEKTQRCGHFEQQASAAAGSRFPK